MYKIDVEIVESVLFKMKRSKAAGLDDLMVEHVLYSHPVLTVILAKMFGATFHMDADLAKEVSNVQVYSVENYRAISISPILSKNLRTL